MDAVVKVPSTPPFLLFIEGENGRAGKTAVSMLSGGVSSLKNWPPFASSPSSSPSSPASLSW